MLHLRTPLRSLLCCALLLLPSLGSFASHIVGADLTYSWVSGTTYKISMAFYADCGPLSAGAFASLPTAAPIICIYNGSTYVSTLTLAIEAPSSGTEVTPPLCPGDSSQCANPSSTIPGITLFRYSNTFTLPTTSTSWRFVFNGTYGSSSAGRAVAITNIVSAGATTMQMEATLNNSTGHNTNPVLNVIPLPYYAINLPQTYNPVAIDAEGDSLVYSLVPAIHSTSSCSTFGSSVTYTGTAWGSTPIAAATPFQVAAGSFSFNAFTGNLSFTPNYTQRSVAVYEIKEYRAGVLIGSLQREITILINSTSNNLPRGRYIAPVGCTLLDSVNLVVCDTAGSFSVQIPATDADATDTLYVTPFSLPSGATFTTTGNGTPTPVSTLSWVGSAATHGLHTFYVTYLDNACPMNGSQSIAYTINIIDCTPVSVITSTTTTIKVFPNPSNGHFRIDATAPFQNAVVTIADVLGRVVVQHTTPYSATSIPFDLSSYSAGTYTIKVVTKDKTFFEKILVTK